MRRQKVLVNDWRAQDPNDGRTPARSPNLARDRETARGSTRINELQSLSHLDVDPIMRHTKGCADTGCPRAVPCYLALLLCGWGCDCLLRDYNRRRLSLWMVQIWSPRPVIPRRCLTNSGRCGFLHFACLQVHEILPRLLQDRRVDLVL